MAPWTVLWMLALVAAGVVEVPGSTPCRSVDSRLDQNSSGTGAKVSLHVVNRLKPPFFDQQTAVNSPPKAILLRAMELAADQDKNFRFSATYFDLKLGWFIDAYNGVYANYSLDSSYWQILDGNLKPLPVGVSHYIPSDGETVTFNLTTSTA